MSTKYLNDLISVIAAIKSKKEMADFLYGMLTPRELEDIPARLQIVRLLKQKIPQYTIAKKLKVGIATVTRGSKELAKGRFKNITAYGWQLPIKGG